MSSKLKGSFKFALLATTVTLVGRDAFEPNLSGFSIGGAEAASSSPCEDFSQPLPPLPVPPGALGDEFVGPFTSWSNLKTTFGAKGDGVTDDTAAIQAALTSLATPGNSPTLYVPAGTYRITQTVTLTSAESVSIVGADPATTEFKWGGAAGGILFHIDGVAYSRFDRITFEGNGTAGVLVDQSFQNGKYFDTGNEYADDVFQNAGIGIRAGFYNIGAAESSVLRDKFINLTNGIILENFNALDWWVWYSYFENSGTGITNYDAPPRGGGNFHVYNSFFNGSRNYDINIGNTGQFNFRNNFSLNSSMFLNEIYYYYNGASTRVQNNTIVMPSVRPDGNSGYLGNTIGQGNMGPTILTDNIFISPPNPGGHPPVEIYGQLWPDCVSVGNTFTVSNTFTCLGGNPAGNAWGQSPYVITLDDKVVSAASVNTTPPILPGALPTYRRAVFEVPSGAATSTIQAAIKQASALCGQRPIVHLPYGTYNVTQTLTIPANCNIQFVGDGQQTRLQWLGTGSGPVLQLSGPSRAILRDFEVIGASVTGIEVDNADQPNSRVFMQAPQLLLSQTANLFVDGLDYTNIEIRDGQFADTNYFPATTGIGLKVVGGPLAQNGSPQHGRTSVFAGSGGANYTSFQASKGASLLVQDFWYEGPDPSTFAQVSDNSTFTVEGSRIALPVGNGDAITLNNLKCSATIMSSAPDSDVRVSGTPTGRVWILGDNFGSAANYVFNLASTVFGGFNLNRYFNPSIGSEPVHDFGATASSATIRTMLAQSRTSHPSTIMDLPPGVTDTRFYRVFVEQGSIGVYIRR